ncbi:tripartite tricarboxylate transporter substrate binding protein [Alcaligenaceae bacterium]|nr:tripartite tricarboxylate transporter substrate binding protein [Alcaligenaceae bacterium]
MRKSSFIAAGLAGLMSITVSAQAENYPDRAISLIIPYAPGGVTDVSMRLVAQKLEQHLGQTIVVENKAGAATTIASNYVSRQKPDGYTLYAASVSLPLNKYLQKNVQYDAFKDFTILSGLVDSPFVLEVSSALGIKTMDELVKKMRENPGKYTAGASGVGAMNHIATESWLQRGKLDALLVQYQGGAQVRMAILGGDIHMTFATLNEALPLKNDGKVEFIAVTTPKRLNAYPDVPTIKESMGLDNFEAVFWTALVAPKGMDQARADKIRVAMQKVAQDEDLRAKLELQGVTLNITDAKATVERMKASEQAFAPIIKAFQKEQ